MGKRHFLHGALILTVAAVLSKLLGLVYRIPFQRMAGDDGLGMYQAVYPLFSTLLILMVSGTPIVLSKMISEQVAAGQVTEQKRIFRLTLFFMGLIGLVGFSVLFFGASFWAHRIGWPESTLAIRTISVGLLFVPFIATLRGYFYGHQDMFPSGTSQVIDQFFRAAAIVLLTYFLLNADFTLPSVVAGASFGTVIGAVFGFAYLIYHYIKKEFLSRPVQPVPSKNATDTDKPSITRWELFKKIVFFTAAVSISSLMMPLFSLADSFTAVHLLKQAFGTAETAQDWFGTYSRGLPMVQVTTVFGTALALSVVPKIAESNQFENNRDIAHSAYLALKISVILGLPAAAGMAILADDINILLYGNAEGSGSLAFLALSSCFLALAMTSAAILQGIGHVYRPAVYLLIALVIKLLLNIGLIPSFSILGAAWATFGAYVVLVLMNARGISRTLSKFVGWKSLILKPMFSTTLMVLVVSAGKWALQPFLFQQGSTATALPVLALLIFAGGLTYGVTLILIKGIHRDELVRIPKFGPKLEAWFQRRGMLD